MPFKKGDKPWNTGLECPQLACRRITLSDGSFYPPIFDLCHCKKHCGTIVYGGKDFVIGHNNIGKVVLEKTRKLMSEHCSMKRPEVAAKHKGENNYNYNRVYTDEERLEMSERTKEWLKTHEHPRGMLGKHHTEEFKKQQSEKYSGEGNPFFDKHHTQETIELIISKIKGRKATPEQIRKQIEAQLGRIPWNKDKPCHSEEQKQKWSQERSGEGNANFGNHLSDEAKICIGNVTKITSKGNTYVKDAIKRNPEILKKMIIFNSPNKSELQLLSILNNLYPNEWKFVGDGSFIIDGKCPDFINCNGKKLIIELFGEHWHDKDEEEPRKEIFKKYGYETLIIWAKELKYLEILINKLNSFMENK